MLGGHLILWDAKVVIEFPHGATILLPSATITHSNIPIQDDETRVSFVQFCSGGLFRWVDNGFQTEAQLEENDPIQYAEMMAKKGVRWKEGLEMFSTMKELSADLE